MDHVRRMYFLMGVREERKEKNASKQKANTKKGPQKAPRSYRWGSFFCMYFFFHGIRAPKVHIISAFARFSRFCARILNFSFHVGPDQCFRVLAANFFPFTLTLINDPL